MCFYIFQRRVVIFVNLLGMMSCIIIFICVNKYSESIISSTRPSVVRNSRLKSFPQLDNSIENRSCYLWTFPSKLDIHDTPQIRLDPNRYLYPGIVHGPNNQIFGLIQSTYMAIKLNRTLVVPTFHAHYLHRGILSPYQAIDVKKLCQFVSCISVEELRKRCGDSFDVVFQFTINHKEKLEKFEKDTGMKIFHPSKVNKNISFPSRLMVSGSNQLYEIPALPNLNSTRKPGKSFPLNSDSLILEYNTSAQCAIATTVFRWIAIPQRAMIAIPLKPNINYLHATNGELISAVIDAVRHPPCIVKVAEDYIRDILKTHKYIGLHWRYNQKDWVTRTCPRNEWKKTCAKISQTTASQVAEAIAKALKKQGNTSIEETPIYIATPLSSENFGDKIYGNISKINKNFMKPTESVAMYLTKRHQECWNANGWSIPEQIISLCEMEVMTRSEWFFYSVRSTWSSNIRPFRFAVNKNGKVTKLYEKDILQLT